MKRRDLPKKIAVLMGGPGSERDVSLATGRGVAKALRSTGTEVVEVDVRDEDFKLPDGVDLAFIAIHGTFGEDGQVQKIFEHRGETSDVILMLMSHHNASQVGRVHSQSCQPAFGFANAESAIQHHCGARRTGSGGNQQCISFAAAAQAREFHY